MRVYLSGPMRGIPEWNYPLFNAAAAEIRARGHECFNPAEHDGGVDPTGLTGHEDLGELGFDLRAALEADTTWICREAEAILVLPGWERSKGAAAEVALGRALGLPILRFKGAA